MENKWNYNYYLFFRASFGIYLFIHFLELLPFVKELFSNQGMLSNGSLSPLLFIFPNVLWVNDSVATVIILTLLGMAGSVCLFLGKGDRLAALILWYILTCFFDRNPFISNPSLPYVGWLLLGFAAIPKVKDKKDWKMPESLFLAGWVAMSAGYSYSGYMKLGSPSWIDGSAIELILKNPLVRLSKFRDILLMLPTFLLMAFTYAALLLELLFGFLALFKKIRPWIWLVMFFMHISLLLLLDFADLTFGMILLHLFTFDPGFLKDYRHIFFRLKSRLKNFKANVYLHRPLPTAVDMSVIKEDRSCRN